MFRTAGLKSDYKEISKSNKFYRVNWNYQPIMINDYQVDSEGNIVVDEDGNPIIIGTHEDPLYASWMTETFYYKPSIEEIKEMILSEINSETDAKILNGFTWVADDSTVISVYLSTENQFNYKAAYDLAYQTEGASLPFRLKFGSTDNPQYYDFTTIEEFSRFYGSCINFINTTLQAGWMKKDTIDWAKYVFED